MDKPKFSEVCAQHNVSTSRLSAKATVSVDAIDSMLLGHPVYLGTAEKVLSAFSELAGQTYTLDNTAVSLLPTNQSEVARLKSQIEDEYNSARLGLQGFVQGASKHLFITKKMENIGKHVDELSEYIGNDSSLEFFISLDNPKQQEGGNAVNA